jgi:hypothetical protein
MNNERAAANINLGIFGGLCSEMQPSELPAGASPLVYDMDYQLGSTETRDGLQTVYTLCYS